MPSVGFPNYFLEQFVTDSHLKKNDGKPIHVAAIDIGTNSTHLLIASINPLLKTFTIELAEKTTTRLGERDIDSGNLTDDAMQRVTETLKNFKDLSISYKVREIITAATSAVREAPNGQEFLRSIKENLGLEVDLVSGSEEARLIYLGVLSSMPFGEDPYILIDIGGGSTELILADGRDARALTSSRIGAVRLQREFIQNEEISSQKSEFLKAFIQGSLESAVDKILKRIKNKEAPKLIATSGTAIALGSLIANEGMKQKGKLQGYSFSQEKLSKLIEKLLKMSSFERKKIPTLSPRRAEIIIPGAFILEKAMEMLSIDNLVLSERALREGLIVDWMIRNAYFEDRFTFQSSIRQRTVIHQVERFSVDRIRAEKVAENALIFYDNTKGFLHNDQGDGRQLLWAAAMLHSCGQHISLSAYHKHSWYLIRNGELLGYSQIEHLMVAAIARYHRRSLPKKRHEAWQLLETSENRKLVSEMSLILRLATSLDKRPESPLSKIKVSANNIGVICQLFPINSEKNVSLEAWNLKKCNIFVKDLCGIELTVDVNI